MSNNPNANNPDSNSAPTLVNCTLPFYQSNPATAEACGCPSSSSDNPFTTEVIRFTVTWTNKLAPISLTTTSSEPIFAMPPALPDPDKMSPEIRIKLQGLEDELANNRSSADIGVLFGAIQAFQALGFHSEALELSSFAVKLIEQMSPTSGTPRSAGINV